jgi:hypothetical protein
MIPLVHKVELVNQELNYNHLLLKEYVKMLFLNINIALIVKYKNNLQFHLPKIVFSRLLIENTSFFFC